MFVDKTRNNCLTANRTLHNQKSLLLKLPAELRNSVYHYAYIDHAISRPPARGSVTHMRVYNNDWLAKRSNRKPICNFLALTETCRQIYRETNLLPFQLCGFGITTYSDVEFADLNGFLDRLSDQKRTAITKIAVKSSLQGVYYNTYASFIEKMVMDCDDFDVEGGCRKEKHFETEKPLINLLARLGGVKSIRVVGVRGHWKTEEEVAQDKKDTMEDCKVVGKWLQFLMKGKKTEVIVDFKIEGV